MENSLKNEELTLKKILYYFRLNRSIKELRKEMSRFNLWEKKSEHVGFTDDGKITTFQKERAGSSNDAGVVNFPQAAAWASLICSGKKTLRDLIPKERALSVFDYERVKREGIWEDDPPELKRHFTLYEEKRKERDKWDIPLPGKVLRKLGRLVDSGKSDQIQEELARIIEPWMKEHSPKELSELLQPNKKREEELKAMSKPFPEGLEIPFPKKYPFGTYFLTVNILAKLYGVRPEIMDAVLTKISKVYRGAKKRQPTGRGAEILAAQVDKYQEIIERMARITAKEIENLESYINTSFRHLYFQKEKQRREIPFGESDDLDKIISQSIFFQEHTNLADEVILAEERKKELRELNKEFRTIFKGLPQRKREVSMLIRSGSTVEETAAKLRVSSRTIKRDLNELRSDFQALHRKYKGN